MERLADWLNSPTISKDMSPAQDGGLKDFLVTLRKGAPGQWSQNLIELARHKVGMVFLAVNTMSNQMYGSSFGIFERIKGKASRNQGAGNDARQVMTGGQVQLPWEDPIHQFFENPNNQDTFGDILFQANDQISITGTALIWTPPNDRGRFSQPKEMYVIPTATAWPMPPSDTYTNGAWRVSPYTYGTYNPIGPSAGGAIIPAEQVLRIKYHHPLLRYDGYAVLTAISLQVDTLEAIDRARQSTQLLGCEQTMSLEFDNDVTELDDAGLARIRQQLQAIYSGPKNAGKLFVVPSGGTLKRISTVPAEMAWQEGHAQVGAFILACYGTPKPIVGLHDDMSYAVLYSSWRAYTQFSMGPQCLRFSSGMSKGIIRPNWGNEFFMQIFPPEFNDENIVEAKLTNDMKAGIRLNGEIRRLRGLDELDDKEHPWINERAFSRPDPEGGGAEKDDKGKGGSVADPNVEATRPREEAARGGMPRKSLMEAFERHKTNGSVHPVKE